MSQPTHDQKKMLPTRQRRARSGAKKGGGAFPKMLPGAVIGGRKKCGRPNCRCADGEQLHGPYYYRYWREGGRLRRQYVKRTNLESVRAACEATRAEHRAERAWLGELQATVRANNERWRRMRDTLREMAQGAFQGG